MVYISEIGFERHPGVSHRGRAEQGGVDEGLAVVGEALGRMTLHYETEDGRPLPHVWQAHLQLQREPAGGINEEVNTPSNEYHVRYSCQFVKIRLCLSIYVMQ